MELISKEPQVIDDVLKNKVHYVGYSHDFDEWIPVNEIINTSPLILPGVMSDVAIHDLSILRFRIKERKLSRYFQNVPLSIQQMKDLFLTYFMMTFGSVAF